MYWPIQPRFHVGKEPGRRNKWWTHPGLEKALQSVHRHAPVARHSFVTTRCIPDAPLAVVTAEFVRKFSIMAANVRR